MNHMKRLGWAALLALALVLTAPGAKAAYADVPAGSKLAGEVEKATAYGLMNGYSATSFGYADSMTRAQFTAVVVRMMGWEVVPSENTTYTDVPVGSAWHDVIETAAAHQVTGSAAAFRPNAAITRGEMAEVLVRALGLEQAAAMLDSPQGGGTNGYEALHGAVPFSDLPQDGAGYIKIAYAIGMTNGTSATTFSPQRTATRAQAAAMLVRMYEKIYGEMGDVHGFYAISSYSQLGLAEKMDVVSAGWSRMTWDGTKALLSTTSAGGNEYCVPSGYSEAADRLHQKLHLSVFMDDESLKALLASPQGRTQAVEQIVHELTVSYRAIGANPYSGVTIDFEGLRQPQRESFSAFLEELKRALEPLDKALYVCVSPVLSAGYHSSDYYDGYDYAAIGRLADRVILMAYDYDPRDMGAFVGTDYCKTAATAPVDQVYLGLRALTQQMDASKVLLGLSCKNTAWKIDAAGKLLSGTPVHPTTETVAKRLVQPDTVLGWSETYQQSYAIYQTEDGSRYFLWYQDERSLESAVRTARLLGVNGISVWRLGLIPQTSGGEGHWDWTGVLLP